MYKAIFMAVFLTLSFTATVSAVPGGTVTPSPTSVSSPSSSTTGDYSVSWSIPSGEYTFVLQQSINYGAYSTIYSGSSKVKSVSVTPGTYRYRVKARYLTGFLPEYSTYTYSNYTTVTTMPPPNAPASITVPSTSDDGSFEITWAASSTAIFYDLHESKNNGSWVLLKVRPGETSYTRTGLTNGDYKYRVRAYNNLGYSNFKESSIVKVNIPVGIDAIPNATVTTLYDNALDNSESVGELKGSASNNGGVFGYSLPLMLPPGRNKMTPSVSLNYSSNGGLGIAGKGWSLSAAGSISRCGSTMDTDGVSVRVQFSTTDKLCLNGQRLINTSGSYGNSGTSYKTEIDSGVIVKQLGGSINSSLSYFEVTSKNGIRKIYGGDSSSRFSPVGTSYTYSWKLSKELDQFSNSIFYYYDTLNGTHLLDEIRYTGTEFNAGNRIVSFDYTTKNRPKSFLWGAEINNNQKLSSVTISTPNHNRYYQLNYKTGNDELLESVSYCKTSYCSTELAQLNLGWSEQTLGYSTASHDINITGQEDDLLLSPPIKNAPDHDGDGSPDFSNKDNYYFSSDPALSIEKPTLLSHHLWWNPSDNSGENKIDGFLDYNGDGRSEIVYLDTNNKWRIAEVGNDGVQGHTVNTGINGRCYFDADEYNSLNEGQYTRAHNVRRECNSFIADINNDGHADILSSTRQTLLGNQVYSVYLRNIDSSGQSTNGFSYYATVNAFPNTGLADVDGDGTLDLYNADRSSWTKIKANSSSINYNLSYDDNVYGNRSKQTIWLELNGDGLIDFLVLKPIGSGYDLKQYWHAVLNKGAGQFAPAVDTGIQEQLGRFTGSANTPLSDNASMSGFIRVLDYNQDGQMDLLYPNSIAHKYVCIDRTSGGQPCESSQENNGDVSPYYQYDIYNWAVLQTNTNGTSFTNKGDVGVKGALATLSIVDYNRDGHSDIISSIGYEKQWSSGQVGIEYRSPVAAEILLYQRNSHDNNLLKSISDSNGVKSKITYQNLSGKHGDGSPLYTHDDTTLADSKYTRVSSTMKVVSLLESRNPNGAYNGIQYSYDEGLLQKTGRGYQGFRYIVAKDLASSTTSISGFMQSYPHTGTVRSTSSWSTSVYESELLSAFYSSGRENKSRYISPSLLFDHDNDSLNNQKYLSFYRVLSTSDYWQSNACNNSSVFGPHITNSKTTKRQINGTWISDTTADQITHECTGDLKTKRVVTTDNTMTHTSNDSYLYSMCAADNQFKTVTSHEKRASVTPKSFSNWTAPASGDSWVKQSYSNYSGCSVPLQSDVTANGSTLNARTVITLDGYGNRERKTMSSTGSGQSIQGTRWSEIQYTTDGYFPYKTFNSQWGLSIAENTLTTHDYLGVVTKSVDVNGVESHKLLDTYDQIKETYSVKSGAKPEPPVKLAYQRCKYGVDCPSEASFVMTRVQNGTPTVKTFINNAGKVVETRTKSFDGSWVYAKTFYDDLGRLSETQTPHFYGSQYGTTVYSNYDLKGRPQSKTISQGVIGYTTDYTYQGNFTQIDVSPHYSTLGGVTSFSISRMQNALGQLVRTTDADTNRTHFAYDGFGKPIRIYDANSQTISAVYNGFGHKVSLNGPNMGDWSYEYNALGELRKQTDANNVQSILNYDSLGRVTTKTANNETLTWSFDGGSGKYGYLMSDQRSHPNTYQRNYQYDNFGRVNKSTLIVDSHTLEMETVYDAYYGRVKGVSTPDGKGVEYQYNAYGYATKDKDAYSSKTYIERNNYSASGQVTTQTFGNGLVQHYSFDEASGLTQQICTGTSSNCNTVSSAQYQTYNYDAFGNLVSRSDVSGNRSEVYQYDNLFRVTENKVTFAGTTLTPIDYTYDDVGNLLKKSDYANLYTYGNSARSIGNAGGNAVRQLSLVGGGTATLTYDNNGNMLTNTDGNMVVSYNAAMKPKSISRNGNQHNFSYDANEMRFKQTRNEGVNDATIYYFGKAYELEINQSGEITHRSYVGDHTLLTTKTGEAAIQHLSKDRLGSVNVISDGTRHINSVSQSALILQHRFNGLFGKTYNLDNNLRILSTDSLYGTNRTFTGHEELPGVGLIHMNGRNYDSALGRFLSVDPFIKDPSNTQSINPYTYVSNNPLSGVDPSGYSEESASIEKQPNITEKVKVRVKVGTKTTRVVTAKIVSQKSGTTSISLSGGTSGDQVGVLGSIIGFAVSRGGNTSVSVEAGNEGNTNQNFGAPVYYDATANGGEFDDIPGSNDSTEKITDVRQRVADLAESKEGDKSYAFDSKKGRFPKESWKCNKFVYDILKEAGVDVPLNPGGDWPLQANGWAQKTTKIPGWIVVDKPMPGDIAAIPRKGTGHVGVYIRNQWGSDVMAANKDGVSWSQSHLSNDWLNSAANATGNTVYRRYVGTK